MPVLPEQLSRGWWLRGLVRERLRFAAREALRRPGVRGYRLAAVDAHVFLRHDGTDAFVLHEAVRDAFYAPPEPVRALLPRDEPFDVLDLGGNLGFFGLRLLSEYPAARITAFEPDPENAGILRRCIAANHREGQWTVEEAFAAPTDGETPFTAGEGALSRAPESPDTLPTMTVPTRDVLPLLQATRLAKIDIEGAEWALLSDSRFGEGGPPALLLEWHSYQCPGDNPRRVAREMLEEHGYTVLHEKPPPVPDEDPLYGAGTLWAWRSDA